MWFRGICGNSKNFGNGSPSLKVSDRGEMGSAGGVSGDWVCRDNCRPRGETLPKYSELREL